MKMMKGKLQLAGIVALALLASLAAEPVFAQRGRGQRQQKKRPPVEKVSPPQQANPPQTPPDGQQGAGAQGSPGKAFVPGRGANAGAVPPQFMQRLRQLGPEEQERFLNNHERFRNMPAERQEQIRRNLRHWNSLTPEQQRELRERERRWMQMSPEQQQHVREDILPKWRTLEASRRQPIMRRLRALNGMSDEEREARLKDEAFLSGLSTEDREMLRELARLRIGSQQEPPPDNPPIL